jgi:5-methylcytosine-specific restriction protein B
MQIDLPSSQSLRASNASKGYDSDERQELSETDPLLAEVRAAISDGFAGAILSGPPGTSKTWYAEQLAVTLAGSIDRVTIIQFHPSYQYEDFIEGWVANESGGFTLAPKHFLQICDRARNDSQNLFLLVIDEISRCDATRVFGEALTYLESSHRGKRFSLASGRTIDIPANLHIIATMNPWDVTVNELDFALLRRFARIEMQPSAAVLRQMLRDNNLEEVLAEQVAVFFETLQKKQNAMLKIGHAYFARVRDRDSLQRLWKFQLRPHFERVCRHDASELQSLDSAWSTLITKAQPEVVAPSVAEDAAPAS